MNKRTIKPSLKSPIGPTMPELENVHTVATVVNVSVQTNRGPFPIDTPDEWREYASIRMTIKGGDKMADSMVPHLLDAMHANTGDSRARLVVRITEQVRAVRRTTIIRD